MAQSDNLFERDNMADAVPTSIDRGKPVEKPKTKVTWAADKKELLKKFPDLDKIVEAAKAKGFPNVHVTTEGGTICT